MITVAPSLQVYAIEIFLGGEDRTIAKTITVQHAYTRHLKIIVGIHAMIVFVC